MKKIFLVLTIVTITSNCLAQETFISKDVTLILPKGVHKLENQKVNAVPGATATWSPRTILAAHVYNVDSIAIGLNDVSESPVNTDLQKTKEFVDDLSQFLKRNGNDSYVSKIIPVNSNHVLLTGNNIDHLIQRKFFCVNASKTMVIAGDMKYDEKNAEKGERILKEMLESIKFPK